MTAQIAVSATWPAPYTLAGPVIDVSRQPDPDVRLVLAVAQRAGYAFMGSFPGMSLWIGNGASKDFNLPSEMFYVNFNQDKRTGRFVFANATGTLTYCPTLAGFVYHLRNHPL